MMNEVFIVAAKRTAIGSLNGVLSSFTAPELGSKAISGALCPMDIPGDCIDAVYMGNVLSANIGQSPARQAAKLAGISDSADATTVNKVCASGLKAVMLAASDIRNGNIASAIAGGMESMSNVPHYVESMRKGNKLGHFSGVDGIVKDGLWDPYHNFHMGNAAEFCVREFKISREEQDEVAKVSYERALKSIKEGFFKEEIVPVKNLIKGEEATIETDEEPGKAIFEKFSKLKPAFEEGGTLTPANSSNINDGAAALFLVNRQVLMEYELKPLAKVISYADAAQEPVWFTTSPAKAIPKAISQAGLKLTDIGLFEINEAYAAVVIANMRLLDITIEKTNINGGAVALGHPIGASGARILVTLVNALKQQNTKYGCAAICNGGGGASAMVIENLTI